jgi:RNA polymerase sigma-70 factor (ECF subfamily)
VILSAYQGLSYPEIAVVLGIPLGTVKTRMYHAFRKLRQTLDTHVANRR